MKKYMKEKFERPQVEIVAFSAEDIITASGDEIFTPGENEGPFVPA